VLINRIEHHLSPKESHSSENKEADDRPCVLAVDEVFSMMSAIAYALGDEYNGSLRGMLQKKFAILYALRDSYNVYTLAKLEEVRDFLQQKTPDLFILDYKMLASDGFNIIHVIRDFAGHEKTPILLSTPEGVLKHVRDAVRLGATDFVHKPANPIELRDKAGKYIKSLNRS
jgi:CheY-like chemotaxis protein